MQTVYFEGKPIALGDFNFNFGSVGVLLDWVMVNPTRDRRAFIKSLGMLSIPQNNHLFTEEDLKTMVSAYTEAALWSCIYTDHQYECAQTDVDFDLQARDDCLTFLNLTLSLFTEEDLVSLNFSQFGYDFWMTSQGHGVGFWDGDWDNYGSAVVMGLSDMSEKFGPTDTLTSPDIREDSGGRWRYRDGRFAPDPVSIEFTLLGSHTYHKLGS